MKKLFFVLLLLSALSSSKAQETNDITWFGLDFSKAKMVGSVGFTNPSQIQSYYLNQWNTIMIAEMDKYSISKYYAKPNVKVNLDKCKANNNKVIASTLVTDNTHSISEADVEAVVKQYKSKEGVGEGLLYVVESFDKTKEMAFIYVVSFDIKSGKINKIKKKEGKAGGFGIRNYWLGAVFNVMKTGWN